MAISMQTCLNDCLSCVPDCPGDSGQSGCFIDNGDSIDTEAIETALKNEDFRNKVIDCIFLYAKKYSTFADNFYNEKYELQQKYYSASAANNNTEQDVLQEKLALVIEKGKSTERLADIYVVLYKHLTGRNVEFRCKPRFEETVREMEDNEVLGQLDRVIDEVENSNINVMQQTDSVNSEDADNLSQNSTPDNEGKSEDSGYSGINDSNHDEDSVLESDYINYKKKAKSRHRKRTFRRILVFLLILALFGGFIYFYAVPNIKNNPNTMKNAEKLLKANEKTVNKFKQRVLGISTDAPDKSKESHVTKEKEVDAVQPEKHTEAMPENKTESQTEELKSNSSYVDEPAKEDKPVIGSENAEVTVDFSKIGDRTCCEIIVGDIDIIAIISGRNATINYPETVTKKQAWKAMSAVYSALGREMANTSISILNDGNASIVFPEDSTEESIESAFKVVADVIKNLVQ